MVSANLQAGWAWLRTWLVWTLYERAAAAVRRQEALVRAGLRCARRLAHLP